MLNLLRKLFGLQTPNPTLGAKNADSVPPASPHLKPTQAPETVLKPDKSSWEHKCEYLGQVVCSNEHGAFALNKGKRQLWLATPDDAFQLKTSEFGNHAYAIGVLHAVWGAKC